MSRINLLLSLIILIFSGSAHAAPKVVTTIKPIQSLTASVMQGITTPSVIVDGTTSPHHYSLKPSDVKSLDQADLIIWVDESVESFMKNQNDTLAASTTMIHIMDIDGLRKLPFREWEKEGDLEKHHDDHHGHDDHHDHDHHDHGEYDPHVWLSADNAIIITKAISEKLRELDPENAAQYTINTAKTVANIRSQKLAVQNLLAPVKDKPFMVFHDAYQYFEDEYKLTNLGTIHLNPNSPPSAGHMRLLRKNLVENGVVCALSEPQFSDKLVNTLIEGSSAKTTEIDPLGAYIQSGPDHYTETIDQLAQNLLNCLQ